MELKIKTTPSVTLSFNDTFGFVKALGSPGPDTRMQLQILPPFDKAYKKINLMFRITRCDINGTIVTLRGTYFVEHLYDTVKRQYGKTTTYKVFEQVADELNLGFASNVEDTNDERYIYNPNKTPIDFLEDEVHFAGDKDAIGSQVYDFWIDFYNCVNFVNVLKECTDTDIKKIWIQPTRYNDTDRDKVVEPVEFDAVVSNHSVMQTSVLHTTGYRPITIPAEQSDIYFESFGIEKREMNSVFIADNAVQSNIFTKNQYGGEYFGDYDYLSQQVCGKALMQKIHSKSMDVNVNMPIFGLQRGDRLRLEWYESQTLLKKQVDAIEGDDTGKDATGDSVETINNNVSGKYYINTIDILYSSGAWTNKFNLIRCFDRQQ